MTKKKNREAFSQMYLARVLEGEVQAWVDQGWPGVTKTTFELLNYWFQRDEETEERFHHCQRRAIEIIIYCHEILQASTLKELFERVVPEVLYEHLPLKQEVEDIRFPKYALKMATGSGKTWVLAALLVWQYFNRIKNEKAGSYSYRFLVVTPGHEVLNRLLDSFKGKRDPKTGNRMPEKADCKRSLFMPEGANWKGQFHLEILEPGDVQPNTTPPDGPFVFITNWQQFRLKSTMASLWDQLTGADVEEIPRGEVIVDFLSQFPDLIIMNDEAHHVHGKKSKTGEELVWRQFMSLLFERLKETYQDSVGPFLQIEVFDHIVQAVHKAIVRLIEGYKYEVKGVWGKLSEVSRIMVRESKSVETDKSIYPRIAYQVKGGGFERDFMIEVLNPSAEVLSYAKLDRRHKLRITYRDETSILRNYEVDFIVKTAQKNYLVETKADKDLNSPNVAVKARAAVAWCEQASTVPPPEGYQQPQKWEYLLLSESLFKNNRGLGLEAFLPLCRGLRDKIIAQAKGQLFLF